MVKCIAIGLRLRKLSSVIHVCNNKGAVQPVHPRSLISNFVICILEVISRLPYSETFNFLASLLAEETGLRLALSETQKTGFLASWPRISALGQILKVQQIIILKK